MKMENVYLLLNHALCENIILKYNFAALTSQ